MSGPREKQIDWLLPSSAPCGVLSLEGAWGLTCCVSHPRHGGQRDHPSSPEPSEGSFKNITPELGKGRGIREGKRETTAGGHIDTKGRGSIWATLVSHQRLRRVFRLCNKPPQTQQLTATAIVLYVMILWIRTSDRAVLRIHLPTWHRWADVLVISLAKGSGLLGLRAGVAGRLGSARLLSEPLHLALPVRQSENSQTSHLLLRGPRACSRRPRGS